MKSIKDFIQIVIEDLKLGKLNPSMQKALEFKIEKMVDRQIENALEQTLTEDDRIIFTEFKRSNPEASDEEAISKVIEKRPEIVQTLETTLDATYNQLMMMGNAAELGMTTYSDENKN